MTIHSQGAHTKLPKRDSIDRRDAGRVPKGDPLSRLAFNFTPVVFLFVSTLRAITVVEVLPF